jgi:hypothetical protein
LFSNMATIKIMGDEMGAAHGVAEGNEKSTKL